MSNVFIDLPHISVTVPGTVSVTQGTTPWVVSGTVLVNQGTSPWVVSATNLDIRDLAFATDKVDVSGSSISVSGGTISATQGTSPWVVNVNNGAGGSAANIQDGGNSITVDAVDFDIRDLAFATDKVDASGSSVSVSNFPAVQPISGTVTANQGTSPWIVSGTVLVDQNTSPWIISGTVAATQSGAWTTVRTWTLSIVTDSVAAVQSGTWNINNISGTISLPTGASTLAEQQAQTTLLTSIDSKLTSPITVTAIDFDIRDLTFATDKVDVSGSSVSVSNFPSSFSVTQGTSPWVVSGTVAATQSGTWNINNISGTISLPTGAATEATLSTINGKIPSGLTVTSTRLLVDGSGVTQPVSGTVSATQGTSPWVSNVNNGAGASAVNIQDGGNSITVDGTVAATQSGIWQTELSARTFAQQTYSVQTASTNIGTTETAFVLIKNPNGSGKTLRITKMFIGINGAGTVRVYHTPTITNNGTTLAITNRYIKTSPTATVMQAFTTPTISVNGTLVFTCLTSAQAGTFDFFNDEDLILDPNFNILITVQNAANNTPSNFSVEWVEV